MLNKFVSNWQARVISLVFILFSVWWTYLQFLNRSTVSNFDNFASTYCVIAIWGGIWGIYISNKWGGFKSILGRSLLAFSVGLFAQAFGQLSYSYFVMIKHIEVPYPSLGDLGYFGSIPLYIYAILQLAKASGISLSLKSNANKIVAIIFPLLLLSFTYYVFLRNYQFDWSAPLKLFLDFAYPLGQSVYVSIALLTYYLSRNILGGRMKIRVLIVLFALFIQYCADFIFLYQANNNQWIAAGINDYIYLVGYFIMTLALLEFGYIYQEFKKINTL